jgi:hypothetical protein
MGRAIEAANTPPDSGSTKPATTTLAIPAATPPISNPQPSAAIMIGNGAR